MQDPKIIDMDYRPATYWPESPGREELLSRIKGGARQDIARHVLNTFGFSKLDSFLARKDLNDEDKKTWGEIHPAFMGGEYLPDPEEGEVEIVRIRTDSTTNDHVSVRARQCQNKILYRVVGEHHDNEDMSYELPFTESDHPLRLSELIHLIDGSKIPGDIYSGGLVISNWESAFDDESDLDYAIDYVSIDSPFYPKLEAYYRKVAE